MQTTLQNNADTSIVLEGHSNGVFYHVVHNFIFLFCLSPYFILCGEEYKLQVKNVGVYHEGVDCLVGLLFQANKQNATLYATSLAFSLIKLVPCYLISSCSDLYTHF